MTAPSFRPLLFERISSQESRVRVKAFLETMRRRRTVRDFSPEPVPVDIVDAAIEAAGTAPSGANRQPWKFVVVLDPALKRRIREAAEAEEREFYDRRAPADWLEALAQLGTDWRKPFLESAPCLVAVFRMDYEPTLAADGVERRAKNYYVQESVGISVGILLTALHFAGLATLTHTPSPMGFLADILGRPKHERPYLLIPVGYPAPGAQVPDISKKTLEAIRHLA